MCPRLAAQVKSTCPFFSLDQQQGPPLFGLYPRYVEEGGSASGVPSWMHRPPHTQLPGHYVPQVQVEMLATGARSCLYVSATAMQGINVLRVERDDAFLTELLHFIRVFWRRVLSGEPPDDGLFWAPEHSERYAAFLQHACRVSQGTSVHRHIRRPWRVGNSRAFGESETREEKESNRFFVAGEKQSI